VLLNFLRFTFELSFLHLTERHPISWVLGSQQLCHARSAKAIIIFSLLKIIIGSVGSM
jgi:hypothetical protein